MVDEDTIKDLVNNIASHKDIITMQNYIYFLVGTNSAIVVLLILMLLLRCCCKI